MNNLINGIFRPQVLVPKMAGIVSGEYQKIGSSKYEQYRQLMGK